MNTATKTAKTATTKPTTTTASNDFGISDNDHATTTRLMSLSKRTQQDSPIRVAILAKFNTLKVNESFSVSTPLTAVGDTPAKKDTRFAHGVRSFLRAKVADSGRKMFTHAEDSTIPVGKITILKTAKQAARTSRKK